VLGGELFQGEHELGGAGDAERDGLPAGFLGALAAGLGLLPAALAMGGQRVVGRVVAVPASPPPRLVYGGPAELDERLSDGSMRPPRLSPSRRVSFTNPFTNTGR
jgi:hypothetical protein